MVVQMVLLGPLMRLLGERRLIAVRCHHFSTTTGRIHRASLS
jgi:hypothetical protein